MEGANLDGVVFAGALNPEGKRCHGDEESLHHCVREGGNYQPYRYFEYQDQFQKRGTE